MVKIKFKDANDDAVGFLELSKRTRVICLQNDIYEIPFSALTVLDAINIPYEIIQVEGLDNVLRKIRDTASVKI
ncbi:MAG: hypothetical protein HY754_02980 [Nitrospirae bacterium]|nr:hypothetical protein [Nitrospirota bacterium]